MPALWPHPCYAGGRVAHDVPTRVASAERIKLGCARGRVQPKFLRDSGAHGMA